MEMAADHRYIKRFCRIAHAPCDLVHEFIIFCRENINHRDRPAAHSCYIMDIDQDRAVSRPVGIKIHQLIPNSVCSQKKSRTTVLYHRRIFTVGSNDINVVDVEGFYEISYCFFASYSVILSDGV